jgi:hypothetical protein
MKNNKQEVPAEEEEWNRTAAIVTRFLAPVEKSQ